MQGMSGNPPKPKPVQTTSKAGRVGAQRCSRWAGAVPGGGEGTASRGGAVPGRAVRCGAKLGRVGRKGAGWGRAWLGRAGRGPAEWDGSGLVFHGDNRAFLPVPNTGDKLRGYFCCGMNKGNRA